MVERFRPRMSHRDAKKNASLLGRLVTGTAPRIGLDVAWCLSFVLLLWLSLRGSPGDVAVQLRLAEGGQRQALYKGNKRVGTIQWRVRRAAKGWTVTHRFWIHDEPAARVVLSLRNDLSLGGLQLDADVAALGRLSSVTSAVLSQIEDLDRIQVRGTCSVETGDCKLLGRVGRHGVNQTVTAGRGPVVVSAIYPLLARGSLGKKAELRIFDPLSLGQRVVTFQIQRKESLELRSGTFPAIKVLRDLEGLVTHVWIDSKGRVLKEELPLGLVVEHESWDAR
jgi:hypothetical protein